VKVVGITGTNGKTTVTNLVDGALRALGRRSGRVGTIGAVVDGADRPSSLTTPEAPQLQALLAEARDAGVEVVTLEASSIGLAQRRVDAIPFHLGVFTNLSRDHLDFHGDMDAYAAAKARLFRDLLREAGGAPRALLCGDDPAWLRMRPPEDRWLYGFGGGCDLRIARAELGPGGMALQVATPAGEVRVESPLVGRHNALNLAAALGCCLCLGVDAGEAAAALGEVGGVAGRLEPVANDRGLLVLVDYAHTPDALEAAMTAVREVATGELWVVFGCGGDRDRGKRVAMGEVVARLADWPVVTSDNPRSEDPRQIVYEVLSGMDRVVRVELDRAEAIRWTLDHARPGDAVLVAGKGHESYQEIDGVRHPFDDRDVAARALEAP
jgi:UDP-N-acetylmuramyl-tripeptide synthetase